MVQRGYRTGIFVLAALFFLFLRKILEEVRSYRLLGPRVPSPHSFAL